jgi:hypothetical protein
VRWDDVHFRRSKLRLAGEKIPSEPERRKRKRAAGNEVVLPVVSEASKERRTMKFFLFYTNKYLKGLVFLISYDI